MNGNYVDKPKCSSTVWCVGAVMIIEIPYERLQGDYSKQVLSTNYPMKKSKSYTAAPRFCPHALEFYRISERCALNPGDHARLRDIFDHYDYIIEDLIKFNSNTYFDDYPKDYPNHWKYYEEMPERTRERIKCVFESQRYSVINGMIKNREWFAKLAKSKDPIAQWKDLKSLGPFTIPKHVPDYADYPSQFWTFNGVLSSTTPSERRSRDVLEEALRYDVCVYLFYV